MRIAARSSIIRLNISVRLASASRYIEFLSKADIPVILNPDQERVEIIDAKMLDMTVRLCYMFKEIGLNHPENPASGGLLQKAAVPSIRIRRRTPKFFEKEAFMRPFRCFFSAMS